MFSRLKQRLKKLLVSEKTGLEGLSKNDRELILRIQAKNLTYLSSEKLRSIVTTCRLIEESKLPGIFIEAGCARGGSSILIASVKVASRPFFIYDVFGMIPPPTDDDTPEVHDRYSVIKSGKSSGIGGDKYYGYEDNLYETVLSNLKSFGVSCDEQKVSLVKGMVQDTMKIDQPVAFAHFDVDWYEPVMTCLERIFPNLSIGGSIIIDDYQDWGGARRQPMNT